MLNMKELLKLVALETLVREVKEHALWRKLYVLPEKNLLKMKQAMENHLRVEKTSLLQHGPSCFYKTNQHEGPSK
jgi:hypothetical protein